MAQISINRFLRHGVVYRVGFLGFNNTMVLSSKKSINLYLRDGVIIEYLRYF